MSIPNQEGLRALHFFLEQTPEPSPATINLLRLAELILTLNNSSYNSSHLLQVRRLAKGTLMGPANVDKGASKMSTFFLIRGFSSTVVDRVLNRVQPISRTSAFTPSLPSCNSDRVPLVLTYHPTNIHIQKVIRCHFHHIQQDATTKHIFPSPPLYDFRRDRSLWDALVNSFFNWNMPPTAPQHLPLQPAK
eukprot:g20773.t1